MMDFSIWKFGECYRTSIERKGSPTPENPTSHLFSGLNARDLTYTHKITGVILNVPHFF